MVLIPKKSGAEDLGDFRPISLLGGLYKLLAKVLANRLKKVIGKVVSIAQNAFVMGRQILDAFLIANEVIDSWQKKKAKGLICKLDIEKAYDSINWNFLMKVLKKWALGLSGWDGCGAACPLLNSQFLLMECQLVFSLTLEGFVKGDPLSPYLFVMGMEVLTSSSGERWRGISIRMHHSGCKEQVSHLSWILFGLKRLQGGVLALSLLGTPLGFPIGATSMWDGVEERGGGNLEGKVHLVKWDVVCTKKNKGGLGLRKIAILNRALLGKWIWRFACEKDNLWKQVITTKYGQENHGWRSKKASGAAGVGVWKEILKESDWCWENLVFLVGKGSKIKFWKDIWCTDVPLSHCFNHLFVLATHWDATIEEMWDQDSGQGDWNLVFVRDFNDWELDMVGDLLHTLRGHRPSLEEDSVMWRQGRNGLFRVKEAYRLLDKPNATTFPSRSIWVDRVPTKVCFFAWEATWGKVLTLDRLQIRGVQFPNCCFLCGCEEENVNHILLHCIVTRALWDIIFGLVDVKWVFPETVKETLTSWRGPFVGKKRKKIWKSIPSCIFWTIWKERNRLAFKGGVLNI
ncbi:putative ribonuclease H protein [Vitis vinifera]|uniref:Putative ribonuclease H protein n=1 Tax=Vitis vinifera TaxID=29760 RepID=A0A438EYC4_VITVI|nr:putative ribonuclease H protein [Vitis vinifera]